MLAVEPPLLLLLLPQLILLPPVQIVQGDAQDKRRQHGEHHDHNVMVDRLPLLLDGLHRHIAHQEDRPAVDRPHVVEGVGSPDIVIKQDVPPGAQAVLHLRLDLRILNIVRAVKIVQIQVSRAALSHSLGLQNKALALRVHDIQRRLLAVKSVGKRPVYGVIHILGIKGPDSLSVPLDRAFDGVGPCSHMVQIGLGDRHSCDRSACGEIQTFLSERLPGIGYSLRPA